MHNMITSIADRIPLLVLLLFSAALLSATAPCQAEPILDADGDPVRVGSLYRLNLVGIGFFGGLTTLQPANKNSTACARHIGLGEETDPGLPLSITPGTPSLAPDGILRDSVRSRIAFQTSSRKPCADPGIWTAVQGTYATGPFRAVVAGRETGTPLPTSEWFEVRKGDQERAYKLIYCPVCLTCEVLCLAEVGGYNVDGKTVLGVGNVRAPAPLAFPVRFVKNRPPTAAAPAATSVGSS